MDYDQDKVDEMVLAWRAQDNLVRLTLGALNGHAHNRACVKTDLIRFFGDIITLILLLRLIRETIQASAEQSRLVRDHNQVAVGSRAEGPCW
jgi:hypothetical protein